MNPQTVKRIKIELQQHKRGTEQWFQTFADPKNIANVHFSFMGPLDSEYEGGLYHGVIFLPDEYPMKPPNIQFYTESGRFETYKNICTNFTTYHEEEWLPTWNLRNIILGLRSMFTDETPNAIGSILCSKDSRRLLAQKSAGFVCRECGCAHKSLNLVDEQAGKKLEEKGKSDTTDRDEGVPLDNDAAAQQDIGEQTHTAQKQPEAAPDGRGCWKAPQLLDYCYTIVNMRYKALKLLK